MQKNPQRNIDELLARIYGDEPISPRREARPEKLPAPIQTIRSLEGGLSMHMQSREALFVKQAKVLEHYEDDCPYNREVIRYFPTYQSLSDRELRGYFTWRTRMRKGSLEKTSLSFAFLYIYELLNQVGCTDPMDGYRKLREFADRYGVLDRGILPYINRWLWDYVIYYELDLSLLGHRRELGLDRALQVLMDLEGRPDREIVEALTALSSYHLDKSRFYRKHPAETDAVIVGTLRAMDAHYERSCKKTWLEDYVGTIYRAPVHLFESAVFAGRRRVRTGIYPVNPVRRYQVDRGTWSVTCCDYSRLPRHKIGDLLRTIDAMMRISYDFPYPTKSVITTKWLLSVIQQQINGQLAAAREAEKKTLHLDLSRLSGIRQDAAYTRDRLMVDEEMVLPTETAPAPAPEPPPAVQAPENTASAALLPEEQRYLRDLLTGGDLSWVSREGYLSAVLTDSINEKLFDAIGDTVLDDSGVIEDYLDDLKEMMNL